MDPTAKGDLIASKVRAWYERNREGWFDRHWPFGAGPDRSGAHADDFMIRFINAVRQADWEVEEMEKAQTTGRQTK